MYADKDQDRCAEPSAQQQMEGRLGDLDKLVMLIQALKTMTPPSPPPGVITGPPSPGAGPGPVPMGPSPMGGPVPPMMPFTPPPNLPPLSQAPQEAMDQRLAGMRGLM